MVKPTKWLEPAKYGRPREGPPDGGDEWQPSRFWAYDDGTFIDDLEGAQDVEFVVEPGAVREQENELVLKVTWFDPRDGEDCEDWMPYEHLKPDFGPELKRLEKKLNPTFFGPERDLLMKYKDIETDEQSSSGEEDTAAPAPAPKTQDERADFDGPYGSDDDSDDVVSDDDTTWLDKLKKRKGPPQWPKEEAIDHGIEQLTKLMPKGSRAVDAEKRGKMREKFNEAIHPHWHKTEGVDWDKVVKDALAYATGGPLAPVPAPAAPAVPAPTNEWVQVGPSTIQGAGNGLFAKKDIPKGTGITNYMDGAVKLNEAQFRALYPTGNATHAWSPKKGVYYDAANPTNLASSANRGTVKTNNARIMASGSVKTTKNIKAGAEIFLPYGGSFQIKEAQSSSDSDGDSSSDDDVDYWALPNDTRWNPNRYGYDPERDVYLYHDDLPPKPAPEPLGFPTEDVDDGPAPPTILQAAAAARKKSRKYVVSSDVEDDPPTILQAAAAARKQSTIPRPAPEPPAPTILQAAANVRQLRERKPKEAEEEWPFKRFGKPKPIETHGREKGKNRGPRPYPDQPGTTYADDSDGGVPELYDRDLILRIIDKRNTAEGVQYFVRTANGQVSWITEAWALTRPEFEAVLEIYKVIYETPVPSAQPPVPRAPSPTYTELVTTDEDEMEDYVSEDEILQTADKFVELFDMNSSSSESDEESDDGEIPLVSRRRRR
jgi:hypothetical protein